MSTALHPPGDHKGAGEPGPVLCPGLPFNPSRRVCGFNVADAVAVYREIPDGAKRLYERLVRWSGDKGHCFYSYDLMAAYMGKPVRTLKRDMDQLTDTFRLIKITHRGDRDGGRTSNLYEFIWWPFIEQGYVQFMALKGRDGKVPPIALNLDFRVGELSAKSEGVKCQIEGGKVPPVAQEFCKEFSKESVDDDYDQPPELRKNREAQSAHGSSPTVLTQIASLLEQYFGEKPAPTRHCIEIRDILAEHDCSIEQLTQLLVGLIEEGYLPETKNGPRTWAWFPVTIRDRLQQKKARTEAYPPPAALRPDPEVDRLNGFAEDVL